MPEDPVIPPEPTDAPVSADDTSTDQPGSVTTELTFRIAQVMSTGNVEDCYSADLARSCARAIETGNKTEVNTLERKLKAKFGKEINLKHFRQLVNDERKIILEELAEAARSKTGFLLTNEGTLKPCLANAMLMLETENVPIRFNALTSRVFLSDLAPWGTQGQWTDHDDALCAEWMQHKMLMVEIRTVADAAEAVARRRQPHFHPVLDYLRGLQWDGELRLDEWTIRYFGAPDTPYVRAVSSKWMLSACKRVAEPGCQADYTLVLEGGQGKRKSSALRALAGSDWFTDDVDNIGTKDSAMQLQGKWIVELAELDSFKRAEVTTIKAWLARREDHFRPPYGRRTADFPRQNVFAATTNKDDWGLDDTGLRRFWPVPSCGFIDVIGIAAARDQLWAEAWFRYQEGELTYLSETLESDAAAQQSARQEVDAWRDIVEAWVAAPARQSNGDMYGEALRSRLNRIYVYEVLQHCVQLPRRDWTANAKARVSRVLKLAGYAKRRETPDESADDGVQREYWTVQG